VLTPESAALTLKDGFPEIQQMYSFFSNEFKESLWQFVLYATVAVVCLPQIIYVSMVNKVVGMVIKKKMIVALVSIVVVSICLAVLPGRFVPAQTELLANMSTPVLLLDVA